MNGLIEMEKHGPYKDSVPIGILDPVVLIQGRMLVQVGDIIVMYPSGLPRTYSGIWDRP